MGLKLTHGRALSAALAAGICALALGCSPEDDGGGGGGDKKVDAGVIADAGDAAESPDSGQKSDIAPDAGPCNSDPCECRANADCDALEDGNACNGTLYCELVSNKCKVVPASIVSCDTTNDTECSMTRCDAKTGKCAAEAEDDGTTCDDGLACTVGDGCKAGTCAAGDNQCECDVTADCKDKEDGDLCNGTLYCDKSKPLSKCVLNPATVVQCNHAADTGCFKNQCHAKTGKCEAGPVADGSACDFDGNKCTADTCTKGECGPGPIDPSCQCKEHVDCAKFEDGNLCNGTLYCNKANGACQLNVATVVQCPVAGEGACAAITCDASDGKCKTAPAKDGTTCDDGVPCTSDEKCKGGACELVELSCACTVTAECAAVDDKDACNGALYCDKAIGKCRTNPATVVKCPLVSADACTTPACDKKTGKCVGVPIGPAPCEADGSPCTGIDYCVTGKCEPGGPTCPCGKDADCAKGDVDKCVGAHFCNLQTKLCELNKSAAVKCPEGLPCMPQRCDPKTGKCGDVAAKDGTACDADDFLCTADTCKDGKCSAGANKCSCGDHKDCAQWEDGKLCNGTLACDNAKHLCDVDDATLPSCAAALPGACTAQACDEKAGGCVEVPANSGKSCDDGAFCTVADACKDAKCAGLPAAATAGCTDDDACTVGDLCKDGACVSGPAADCDDKVSCTMDSCDAKKGCANLPVDGNCDDGIACTADVCAAKSGCVALPNNASCTDGVACTDDSCNAQLGCLFKPDAAKCDDGDVCNGPESCKPTGCAGGKAKDCDDGNSCTKDACDKLKGCASSADPQASCSDGTGCTDGDKCDGTTCKPGKELTWGSLLGAGTGIASVVAVGKNYYALGNESGTKNRGLRALFGAATGGHIDSYSADGATGTQYQDGVSLNGKLVAVGAFRQDNKKHVGLFSVVSNPNSGVDVQAQSNDVDVHHYLKGAVAFGGGVVAAGWRTSSGGQLKIPWLARLGSDNKIAWVRDHTDGTNAYYESMAAFQGGMVAVGASTNQAVGLEDATFALIDKNGNVTKVLRHGGKSMDIAYDVVVGADASAYIAGVSATAQGTTDGWVAKRDGNGALRWQHLFSSMNRSALVTVIADGGTLWAAGYGKDAKSSKNRGFLAALDTNGNVQMQRLVTMAAGETTAVINGLQILDKGIMVGGAVGTSQGLQGVVRRLSDFGDATCAEAGKCWDAVNACSDGKPCTRDSCHPVLGCQNVDTADNGGCDDGAACTVDDRCQAGACVSRPLLWVASNMGTRFPNGVAALEGDQFVVVGADNAKQGQGWWALYEGESASDSFHYGVNQTSFGTVQQVTGSTIAIGGKRKASGANVWSHLVVLGDATTEQMQEVVVKPPGAWADSYGLAASADRIVQVGTQTMPADNKNDAVIIAVPVADFGQSKVVVKHFGGTDHSSFGDAQIVGANTLVAGAYGEKSKPVRPWVMLLDKDLKVLWDRKHEKMGMAFKVALRGNLVALGGHFAVNPDKQQHMLILAKLYGGFLNESAVPDHGLKASRTNGVQFTDDGHLIVTSQHSDYMSSSQKKADPYLYLYDGALGPQRVVKLSLQANVNNHIGAVTPISRGRYVATGNYGWGPNGRKGFMAVFDRFLNTNCNGSLRCVNLQRSACADEKPCSMDYCAIGKCAHVTAADKAACDDGKPCTFAACDKGACKSGAAVKCDDGDECTIDSCDPQVGCKHAPNCVIGGG